MLSNIDKVKIFPVKANDLIIINPNISHTELGLHSHPMKYIVLGIEGLELSSENDHSNAFKNIKKLRTIVRMRCAKPVAAVGSGGNIKKLSFVSD